MGHDELKNLTLSLLMILGLLLTSFSRAVTVSAVADVPKDIRYKEIPKIILLLAGISLLLAGFSHSLRERNAKVIGLAFLGLAMILAYFFVLTY
jgi:peptidoglycan/LPS O-acetylase OafA/YrhL